jgi:hypothetical protein
MVKPSKKRQADKKSIVKATKAARERRVYKVHGEDNPALPPRPAFRVEFL